MDGRFPEALGLSTAQVEDLVATASRAPSLHNSQPWRFRIRPDVIELLADPERRLAVADPDGREMRIACGAALFNLRLGLIEPRGAPAGLGAGRPRRPAGAGRDPARRAAHDHPGTCAGCSTMVPRRRTNRRPFTDTDVGPDRSSSRYAGPPSRRVRGSHVVCEPEQRDELGRLARLAHLRQTGDPAFRAELAAWTGHDGDRDDGVPARAGGPLPAPNQTWVTRDFSGGTRGTAAPEASTRPSP